MQPALTRSSLTYKHSPIDQSFLPTELLSEIFEAAVYSFSASERDEVNRVLLPALLSTCSRWRAVALITPSVWTFIDFRYHQTKQGSEVSSWTGLDRHLKLSRNRDLDVKIDVQLIEDSRQMQYDPLPIQPIIKHFHAVILPHRHRFKRLDVTDGDFVPFPHRVSPNFFWSISGEDRQLGYARDCPKWALKSSGAVPSLGFVLGLEQIDVGGKAVQRANSGDVPNVLVSLHSLDITSYGQTKSLLPYFESLRQLRSLRIVNAHTRTLHLETFDFPVLECLSLILQIEPLNDAVIIKLNTPNLRRLQVASGKNIIFIDPSNINAQSPLLQPELPHLKVFQLLRSPLYSRHLPPFVRSTKSFSTLSLPITSGPCGPYSNHPHATTEKASKENFLLTISAFAERPVGDLVLRIVCLTNKIEFYDNITSYLKMTVEIVRHHPRIRVEFIGGSNEELGLKASDWFGDLVSSVKDRWVFLGEEEEDLFGEWFDTTKLKGL